MTCEDALLLISGHIDQENTMEEEAQLRAHLENCEECRSVLQAFLEMDAGIADLEMEPPAKLRENVMNAIRAEAVTPKKKFGRRWVGTAVAAVLVLVIGAGVMQMPSFRQETETAAPMTARAMPEPMEAAAMPISAETEVDAQQIADARQAYVAVTYELLPEMEVCPCETLDGGALLYLLENADGAVELSRLYGVELVQPAAAESNCSYALLLPNN